MIAKAIKGRGFRGVLAYDLGKEQARVIDSNMTGRTPRELAQEFGAVRKLRPGLGKAVLHVSLSAAPGEQLSDGQWTQIAGRYLAGMGLDDNQYLLTRHADTRHEHVHLLVNRVRCDGGVASAITVAEFGALAGLSCHAPGRAEGPAARYALLQASGGTVATAAAPCLERMAHLPDPPLPPRLSMPQGAVRKRSSGRAR